jgi:hypothetical protein
MPAAVSAMFVFVFDAVVLFGLARLTDLITAVHAARDELAEAAVTEERVDGHVGWVFIVELDACAGSEQEDEPGPVVPGQAAGCQVQRVEGVLGDIPLARA